LLHSEKVDSMEKKLLIYKTTLTTLDVAPCESYYVDDPNKVLVYQNRVNIDMRKFIERQVILARRLSGMESEFEQEEPNKALEIFNEKYFRVVKNKPEVYDIITRSFLRKKNWTELPHG
jgi:tubulin polyglutamylase TTLL5